MIQEAAKWYNKAADQGYAYAQVNLGLMYYNGEGVLQNKKEAVKWYRKAAEQGFALAQNGLGNMYSNGAKASLKTIRQAVKWFRLAADQGCTSAIQPWADVRQWRNWKMIRKR